MSGVYTTPAKGVYHCCASLRHGDICQTEKIDRLCLQLFSPQNIYFSIDNRFILLPNIEPCPRCKQGGYCDFTAIRNANNGNGDVVYAAFGTRNTGVWSNGWSSHSVCWTSNCNAGVTWKVGRESGSDDDD